MDVVSSGRLGSRACEETSYWPLELTVIDMTPRPIFSVLCVQPQVLGKDDLESLPVVDRVVEYKFPVATKKVCVPTETAEFAPDGTDLLSDTSRLYGGSNSPRTPNAFGSNLVPSFGVYSV